MFRLSERSQLEKTIVMYDSNHTVFWKTQKYGHNKKVRGCLELRCREGRDKKVEHRWFLA